MTEAPGLDPSQGPAARLAAVKARMAEAARAAGRPAEAVALVAVSKTKGAADILPVL